MCPAADVLTTGYRLCGGAGWTCEGAIGVRVRELAVNADCEKLAVKSKATRRTEGVGRAEDVGWKDLVDANVGLGLL